MSDKDIITIPKGCGASLGRIKGIIFIPVQEEAKQLDPITEDAEFEVVEPKMLEHPQPNE